MSLLPHLEEKELTGGGEQGGNFMIMRGYPTLLFSEWLTEKTS